jgi:hypothetical protein
MIHRFRWYIIGFFILIFLYVRHDGTNYRVPHPELLASWIVPSIAEAKSNMFDVEKNPILYNRKDIACLAKNIYFEAGTEPMLGKLAVAQVTINRVKNGYWGDTVCDVVNAKDQFSWTNRDDQSINKESLIYRDSLSAARKVLSERRRLRVLRHALFYHADYVRPNWVDRTQKIGQIGTHVFYNGAKGSSLSL